MDHIQRENLLNLDARVEKRIGTVEEDVWDLKEQVTSSFKEFKEILTRVAGRGLPSKDQESAKGPSLSFAVDSAFRSHQGTKDCKKEDGWVVLDRHLTHFEIAFDRTIMKYHLVA